MTVRTNSRVAGFAFLVYIVATLAGVALSGRAMSAEGAAAKLAGIAAHAFDVRLAIVLELTGCFCALVLAVTLYAITRGQDPDLALLAMVCRVAEGVIGAASLSRGVGRLWLSTAVGADAPDPAAAAALGAYLFKLPSWSSTLSATFFAVGSTLFAFLMLRGRMVPAALAGLGVLASILVVVLLPLELVGIARSPVTDFMWIPMLAFELWLALWLIFKGARTRSAATAG
jgi:Domain of unknown function (DUF4386)